MKPADIDFMREAIAEARKGADLGEVPVGAVLVRDGRVIARGFNQPISSHDPSAHAEMIALRAAAAADGNYRLPDTTLYVTLEPCTMCAGLLVHSRIKRLVYGASEPRSGAVVSRSQVLAQPWMNHRVEVEGGVLAEECGALLTEFFRLKRQPAQG
ncbi:tRNA adenosine(34) deaminase TadA [Halopseudomonas phragmitis]|uniref:tRNA-specific adenosine deaminase n=2 Tax=Pseudomonadaceae TaxID=135621 RepID=A0A1V0B0L6_9GAMM|nr:MULTISPECIES: tRNA adenosine(34) deaminase TadA [Pseudomonadaceae]AQZ93420.1 tRNA adenosine(34) deaminase TadA [Halopseudomonas phragmitis]RHW19646.1 tRNA adenosine(34) deaminase TadA [Pseudomonas jilinensis]